MRIARLKELLNKKYDPLRQVADYARLLDINAGQLNKLIETYTGKSATTLIPTPTPIYHRLTIPSNIFF